MPEGSSSQQYLADVLWEAMWVARDSPANGNYLKAAYRSKIYEPVVERASQKIREHRNPEPYLSLRSSLEFLAGQGWSRAENRYQGIVGGRDSELEYRALASGKCELPLLLVAGYPRSGTTSMQTIVRWSFPHNICEIDTVDDRFSLWEYPKHNSEVIARLLDGAADSLWVLIAFRPFIDCAASLVVGRGSPELVDVHRELQWWESWLPLLSHPRAIPIVFNQIKELTPFDMSRAISLRTGVGIQRELGVDASYENLMLELKKGVVDDSRKSNVPQASRNELLREAREWVVEQLGRHEERRLHEVYEHHQSQIVRLNMEDPS